MCEDSPKPARPVYHCSICGRPLSRDGGRLRLVCRDADCHGDRPRPAPIQVREGDENDRVRLIGVSKRFFGSSHLHVFGEVFPLSKCPFLVVEFDDERAGYLSYAMQFPAEHEATVVLMVVLPKFQGRGVGKALQGAMDAVCRPQGIRRLHVSTTNDNIPGLYFYQRLGYRLHGLDAGRAAEALAAQGETEQQGFGGIPIRDEIHLIKDLERILD